MAEKIVEIPSIISVRDLAARVKMSPINIIRELMNNGVMASINQQIDFDTAAIDLQGLGYEPREEKKIEEASTEELSGTLWNRLYAKEDPNKLKPRPWGLNPEADANQTFYETVGCDECQGSGFRGRSAVAELVEVTDTIRGLIMERRPASEIYAAAQVGGTVLLRDAARAKARGGVTSVAAINRVTFAE